MTATGFLGLMKMDTLIINPTEKDLPLFSYDRVHAMGNDTLIYGLYDTLLEEADLSKVEAVKAKCAALPDHELGEHWYDHIKLPVSLSKKGKKAQSAAFDDCTMEYLEAFLDAAEDAPWCDPAGKQAKASVYVEGLLEHGDPPPMSSKRHWAKKRSPTSSATSSSAPQDKQATRPVKITGRVFKVIFIR